MHRAGWAGVGRPVQADEDISDSSMGSYSKGHKPKQSLGRRVRQALRQTGWLYLAFGVALLLLGLAALRAGWQRESGAGGMEGQLGEHYQGELDLLIQRVEAERLHLLSQLLPVYDHWQGLREEVADKEERKRDAKADLEKIEELMGQRRESLGSLARPGWTYHHNNDSALDLELEWQEEEKSIRAVLDKAVEQANDASWREEQALLQVQDLRDKVLALEAAVVDLKKTKAEGRKPRADHLHFAKSFDHSKLVEQYAPYIKAVARIQAKMSNSDVRASLEALVEKQTAHLRASLGTIGDWRFERGDPYPPTPPPPPGAPKKDPQEHPMPTLSALAENLIRVRSPGKDLAASILHKFRAAAEEAKRLNASGLGGASPPPARTNFTIRLLELEQKLKARVATSQGGAGGGEGGSLASNLQPPEPVLDDSVRCRMSGICQESSGVSCSGKGDELRCISHMGERQRHVREAIMWSWQAYKQHCWGQDELKPLSNSTSTWFQLGLTLVDSLDTLWLAGLRQEYREAVSWVAERFNPGPDQVVNLFESTIRVLGGLLAAFHLGGGDARVLAKAAELGLRLSPALHSPSGIPYSDVNLKTLKASSPSWTSSSSLSEVTTLSLEFTYLARVSGEWGPGNRTLEVMQQVLGMEGRVSGLAPVWVDPVQGVFNGALITLGARGDSYYEYLLKQWILSGKTQDVFLRGYKEAMRGVRELLLKNTRAEGEGGLLYIGELHSGQYEPKMDHLVCFMPGLFALGHLHGVNTSLPGEPDDLEVARQLMHTCYQMYQRTPTGLAPEIVFFSHVTEEDFPKHHSPDVGGGDFYIKQQDSHNLLRPETVESLFVLWRVTGDPRYREWGWQIFRAFHKFSRVEGGGYTCLDSVLAIPPPRRDKMESFWLGETLKYLYLLMDDSSPPLVPLDQYVFNTEAHPLPILDSAADLAARRFYLQQPPRSVHLQQISQGEGGLQPPPAGTFEEELQKRIAEWRGEARPEGLPALLAAVSGTARHLLQ